MTATRRKCTVQCGSQLPRHRLQSGAMGYGNKISIVMMAAGEVERTRESTTENTCRVSATRKLRIAGHLSCARNIGPRVLCCACAQLMLFARARFC